jgi:hypothetical protein
MNNSIKDLDTNASFLNILVQSSSDVSCSLSNLSFYVEFNCELYNSSQIIVHGLKGSLTKDNPALIISGPQADVFGGTGKWFQTNGTLILLTRREFTFALFSIELLNQNLSVINENCSEICFPGLQQSNQLCTCPQISSVVEFEVFGQLNITKNAVSNFSFVPKKLPSFQKIDILGSSTVSGSLNKISVTLVPNFHALQISSFTIEGMLGFETPDAPCVLKENIYSPCLDWRLIVSGQSRQSFDLNSTSWNQEGGIFKISTAKVLLSPTSPLLFSFELRNSFVLSAGLSLFVGMKGDFISFPSLLVPCQGPCLPVHHNPSFIYTDISSSSSLNGGLTTITVK